LSEHDATSTPAGLAQPQTRLEAIQLFLDENPLARVALVNVTGEFIPVPDALVTGPTHERHDVTTGFSEIEPGTLPAAVAAFEQARTQGYGQGDIRLCDEPTPYVLRIVNCLDVFHGYVSLIAPQAETTSKPMLTEVGVSTPRIARLTSNEVGVILLADDAATLLLGWTPAELVGTRCIDYLHPDDHDLCMKSFVDVLTTPGPGRRLRVRQRTKDGSYRWFEMTTYNRLDDTEQPHVLYEFVDIAAEMAAQEQVREREALLHDLTEALPVGVLQLGREAQVLHANARLFDILGTREPVELDGLPVGALLPPLDPHYATRLHAAVADVLATGTGRDLALTRRRHSDRTQVHLEVTVRPVVSAADGVRGAVVVFDEVTERIRLRAELEDRATYDQLTRCLNRAAALAALEDLVEASRESGTEQGVGVLFIDLDGFKAVNDDWGHAAGDEMLVVVAQRLRSAVRGSDVVGRIGGDEFVVSRGGCREYELTALVQRVHKALSGTARLGCGPVPLGASVGIAWASAVSTTAGLLLNNADAAMYAVKRQRQAGRTSPPAPREPSAPAEVGAEATRTPR